MDYILQERIDGTLNLAEGTVSELTVWLHDRPEMTVTVTGDMVQTAKNQPLVAERAALATAAQHQQLSRRGRAAHHTSRL